jgi:hypothetical protein
MIDLRGIEPARVLVPADLPAEDESGNWSATGAWSGDRFYLYIQRPSDPGLLWTVQPGVAELGKGTAVAPFGATQGCRARLPVVRGLVAAAGNLFLYEPFGSKADRTGMCGTALAGGAWTVDAVSGRLSGPVAPGFHFNHLTADASGSTLYGVALTGAGWSAPVELVRMDGRDGSVLNIRTFDPGVVQIATGRLTTVPAGDVSALRQ